MKSWPIQYLLKHVQWLQSRRKASKVAFGRQPCQLFTWYWVMKQDRGSPVWRIMRLPPQWVDTFYRLFMVSDTGELSARQKHQIQKRKKQWLLSNWATGVREKVYFFWKSSYAEWMSCISQFWGQTGKGNSITIILKLPSFYIAFSTGHQPRKVHQSCNEFLLD